MYQRSVSRHTIHFSSCRWKERPGGCECTDKLLDSHLYYKVKKGQTELEKGGGNVQRRDTLQARSAWVCLSTPRKIRETKQKKTTKQQQHSFWVSLRNARTGVITRTVLLYHHHHRGRNQDMDGYTRLVGYASSYARACSRPQQCRRCYRIRAREQKQRWYEAPGARRKKQSERPKVPPKIIKHQTRVGSVE